MMKKDAIIVNTCRGPVIDEDALYDALKANQIFGAGLDVMVEEPPQPKHKLFSLPNVIFTPHTAGPTWENYIARFRNGFDNIQRVAAGRAPLWVVAGEDKQLTAMGRQGARKSRTTGDSRARSRSSPAAAPPVTASATAAPPRSSSRRPGRRSSSSIATAASRSARWR